jgi:hypothetical protein
MAQDNVETTHRFVLRFHDCVVNSQCLTTLGMAPLKKIDSITLRVDPDTKAALEALAAADDRTLSAFILKALRDLYGIKPPAKPKAGKAKG